ncbi:hypothetical protein ACJX0J_011201, partial [Zea mays]
MHKHGLVPAAVSLVANRGYALAAGVYSSLSQLYFRYNFLEVNDFFFLSIFPGAMKARNTT